MNCVMRANLRHTRADVTTSYQNAYTHRITNAVTEGLNAKI
jgi:hypothetical protein